MDGWTEIVQGAFYFVIFVFVMRFVIAVAFGAAISKNHIGLKVAITVLVIAIVTMCQKCDIGLDLNPGVEVEQSVEVKNV